MRYVLGLTGGIACGKSEVGNIFGELGVNIIDTDEISRFVAAPPHKCYREMIEAFPDCVENGFINRRKLREKVFYDDEALKKLNSITLPYIKEETQKALSNADGLVLLVVPLMFESGFDSFCDSVATVKCDEETRINRLTARDNITRELALKMIGAQTSDAERERKSDIVIDNNGDLIALKKTVAALCEKIRRQINA